MHFFTDEGGTFTPATGWGVVCSLAIPHKSVGPARREIERLTRDWPRNGGELKGGSAPAGIGLGDKVVLIFSDDQKRISARLSESSNDLEKGRLSASSPLGKAILGAEEGDEVELPLENGRQRKVLIESVEKGAPLTSISADTANALGSAAAVA